MPLWRSAANFGIIEHISAFFLPLAWTFCMLWTCDECRHKMKIEENAGSPATTIGKKERGPLCPDLHLQLFLA